MALAVAAAALFSAPTSAWAGVDTPVPFDPVISKTATNLDGNHESEITLHVEDANKTHDLVLVIDASSRGFVSSAPEVLKSIIEAAPSGVDLSTLRIGIVLFGTDDTAHRLLDLTPLDAENLEKITGAIEKVSGAPEGNANLEAAIALADEMLDEGLAETGGTGAYQTLALVTDGVVTSWGTGDAAQTFCYEDDASLTLDQMLEGHSSAWEALADENLEEWMTTQGSTIEDAIEAHGTSSSSPDPAKVIPNEDAPEATTSLEAGLYRALRLWTELMLSDGPSGQRYYYVVNDSSDLEMWDDHAASREITSRYLQDLPSSWMTSSATARTTGTATPTTSRS